MSLFSKLFGAKKDIAPKETSIEYNGFRITAQPVKEAQGYRLGALIEKNVEGEAKSHRLIRADVISDFETCVDASVSKAKQMIDQMGDRLF